MLVDAVRSESDHFRILAGFLERRAAVRADGDCFAGLQPKAWDIDELTHRAVRPILPSAEMYTGSVRFGPSDV